MARYSPSLSQRKVGPAILRNRECAAVFATRRVPPFLRRSVDKCAKALRVILGSLLPVASFSFFTFLVSVCPIQTTPGARVCVPARHPPASSERRFSEPPCSGATEPDTAAPAASASLCLRTALDSRQPRSFADASVLLRKFPWGEHLAHAGNLSCAQALNDAPILSPNTRLPFFFFFFLPRALHGVNIERCGRKRPRLYICAPCAISLGTSFSTLVAHFYRAP